HMNTLAGPQRAGRAGECCNATGPGTAGIHDEAPFDVPFPAGDAIACAHAPQVATREEDVDDLGVGVQLGASLLRVESVEGGEAVDVAAPLVECQRALDLGREARLQGEGIFAREAGVL